MFSGLLKSKFYTKCHSLMKMAKVRLEALKRKKSSVIKFLKKDMADLLRSGLDYNAYCRAEGLLVEQRMLACYNFIEQFCACISSNLSAMNKQKECPEECREAVQSIIYAAARIAEFPELRDLRNLFTERYRTSLESFISKEFVEILKPISATKETKLQLMHDIADEFSIEWNSKSLEQKLFKPPPAQDEQHKNCSKNQDDIVPKADRQDGDKDGYKMKKNKDDEFTKRDSHDTENKVNNMRKDSFLNQIKKEIASHEKKNAIDERYNFPNSSEDEVSSVHRRNNSDLDSIQASSSSVGSVSEDEVDSKKPFYYGFVPPPYVKPKVEKEEGKIQEPPKLTGNSTVAEETNRQDDSVNEAKPKPRSVRRRLSQPPPGHQSLGSDARIQPPSGHENVSNVEKPLKPPPGREHLVNLENVGLAKTNSSAVVKGETKWGSRIPQTDNVDQMDEEEKMIDGLLMHYSKDKVKLTQTDDIDKASNRKNKSSELPLPSGREAIQQKAATKRHNRAVSLQPETLNGHVHPNMPNYDDLAARFAALKER